MNRYVCVHGHFYQPPRENPWLESIDLQETAYPYHDWNERITAECYGPNAESRILDDRGYIRAIVSNYARMSFNIGPTLLSWMRLHAPETYKRIIWSDCESRERLHGHGNAIAQCYNHMIMPLANERDRRTQVEWGIRDFEHTFGRFPEGMWLPETAVNTPTLEILAELGIRFTILAPRQAQRVRKLPGGAWKDVGGGVIDPSVPYLCKLPGGREISLFFYDGPISQAVAFEGLLSDGAKFARRLESGFAPDRGGPQLVHIATDGESYGHHHRFGDMALAAAFDILEHSKDVEITNYGRFLDVCPPTHQVEIVENSSWSCYHGIERWRSDCGCGGVVPAGWSRAWRGALRTSLDWLRDAVNPAFEKKAAALLKDPWAARDGYIRVVLTHDDADLDRWLERHQSHPLTDAERLQVRQLMEIQRQAMLMFTSCGWFFDELSGLEATQILRYAARCIQLSEAVLGLRLESPFLKRLAQANSNLPEYAHGGVVYDKLVRPAVVDLLKVGAHHAVMSLFRGDEDVAHIHAFDLERESRLLRERNGDRLLVAHGRIRSRVTGEGARIAFAVLFRGDQNLLGGVRELSGHEDQEGFVAQVTESFDAGDMDAAARQLRQYFSGSTFGLASLFRDEQRRIMEVILEGTVNEIMTGYRGVYERYAPLVASLSDLNFPVPEVLHKTMEFVFNANLRVAFGEPDFDVDAARRMFEEAQSFRLQLDAAGLTYQLTQRLDELAARVELEHADKALLHRLADVAGFARELPLQVNFSRAQNVVYAIRKIYLDSVSERARHGDADAKAWLAEFVRAAEKLRVVVKP